MVIIEIHRPEQIGGQITKISTDSASIIIDLGHNLPNNRNEVDPLDNKQAIEEITKGCSAVLYTHYHGDHIGLCQHVPESIPQFVGEIAKQVMRCQYGHIAKVPDEKMKEEGERVLTSVNRMRTYRANEPMLFGDIKVTPYFVSHSACDAHMFIIEAGGKRILHTGDFRGHGWLSKGLVPTLNHYIRQVDVVIIEGTMLSRTEEKVDTEYGLGKKAFDLMKDYKYVFVHCSSTDLERLATFKTANAQCKPRRFLVSDRYRKEILEIFSKEAGMKSKTFDFGTVYAYFCKNVKLKQLMIDNGFLMFVRPPYESDNPETNRHDILDEILEMTNSPEKTLFIYSMWDGYLRPGDNLNERFMKLQNRFKQFGATVVSLHTSGHATMETLREVCETVKPSTAIIPIHRERGKDFNLTGITPELLAKVVTEDCTKDGIEITFKA